MEDFAREARRLSEADYSAYDEERVLVRELLRSAAELGEAVLRKRNAPKEIPYDDIAKLYNDICSYKLPKVLRLSTSASGISRQDFPMDIPLMTLNGFSK
ncbi:MAG: hypothetical protein ACI4RH_03390 [Huintestinicola sp.]